MGEFLLWVFYKQRTVINFCGSLERVQIKNWTTTQRNLVYLISCPAFSSSAVWEQKAKPGKLVTLWWLLSSQWPSAVKESLDWSYTWLVDHSHICLTSGLKVLFENFKYKWLLSSCYLFSWSALKIQSVAWNDWIFYICELQNKIISFFFCSISLFSKVEDVVFQEFCEEIGIENIRVYEQEHVRQQEEIDKRRWLYVTKM